MRKQIKMQQEIDPKKLSILYDAAEKYYSEYISDMDLSEKAKSCWIYKLIDSYLFMESYLKNHKNKPLSEEKLDHLKAHFTPKKNR
jgi:hypothetical protein